MAFNGTNHHGFQIGVNHGTITINTMPYAKRTPSRTERAEKVHLVIPYAENENFVGRKRLLRKLENLLFTPGSPRRAALFGFGGIGKTQIAIQYAHWVHQTLGDVSVFWVNATTVERFRQSYAAIAKECQIPRHDDPKKDVLGLVKDWLEREHDGRWLMVIDNADDTELFFRLRDESPDGDASQSDGEETTLLPCQQHRTTVARTGERSSSQQRSGSNPRSRKRQVSSYENTLGRYIPDCADGTILVTTRNKQAGLRLTKGGPLLPVGEMTENEATELLSQYAQLRRATFDELSWLSAQLERLPLALVQAAGFVQENDLTVSEYSELLEQNEQHFLDLLSEDFEGHGRDPETPDATTKTLFLSFEQIQGRNPLAAELLSLMTFFDRQGVPWDFLCTYHTNRYGPSQTVEIELTKALGVLSAFSLVVRAMDQTYSMHRLVQLATWKWLKKKGVAQNFAETALLVVSQAYSFYHYTKLENLDVCKDLLPHVFAVLKEPTETPDKKLARATLLTNVAGFLDLGSWFVAEVLFTQALDIRKELLGGKVDDHALKCIHGIAQSYYRQGRLDEAEPLLLQVIEASRGVADDMFPNALLLSVTTLALVYGERGLWKYAKHLQVELFHIAKDVQGGDHLNTIHRTADIATTVYFLKDFATAEVVDDVVVRGYSAALGVDHFMTMMAMGCLAGSLIAQKKYQDISRIRDLLLAATQKDWGSPWHDTDDKLEENVDRLSTLCGEDRLDEVRASAESATKAEVEERPEWEDYVPVVSKIRESFSKCTRQGLWEDAEPLPAEMVKGVREEIDCGDAMVIDAGDGQHNSGGVFDCRERYDDLRQRVFILAARKSTIT